MKKVPAAAEKPGTLLAKRIVEPSGALSGRLCEPGRERLGSGKIQHQTRALKPDRRTTSEDESEEGAQIEQHRMNQEPNSWRHKHDTVNKSRAIETSGSETLGSTTSKSTNMKIKPAERSFSFHGAELGNRDSKEIERIRQKDQELMMKIRPEPEKTSTQILAKICEGNELHRLDANKVFPLKLK
jgi:hypothetical protein